MSAGRVLLAMPCLHGYAKMGAMKTLTEVGLVFHRAGFGVAVAVIAPTDILIARNFLAGAAVAERYTHLFLMEPELGFPPSLAGRMLSADKDVVGLVHALEGLELDRLIELARSNPGLSEHEVVARAHEYMVRLGGGTVFVDGMARVLGVGTGAILIRTAALRALIDNGSAKAHPPLPNLVGEPMPHWGFFDPLETADGETLYDGFAFSARLTAAGGEVWALSAPHVTRTGDFEYTGDVLEALGT